MKQKLLFVVNDMSFFCSHRLPIAERAVEENFEVAVACPTSDDKLAFLKDVGITHFPIDLNRGGTNPFREVKTSLSIFHLIRNYKPTIVHLITAKPILYGGIGTRLLGIPSLAAFTGMGAVFTHSTLKLRILQQLVISLYKLALNRDNSFVLFQNPEDLESAKSKGIISRSKFGLIPGSGVDLEKISATPLPSGPPVALLPARMLKDKGVCEFVEAARILKSMGVKATFRLLGNPDPDNPSSIQEDQLHEWTREGIVEWRPYTSDIGGELSQCHLVVLPSYREGFPKSLIDAAAAGRACVASNVTGCKHAVIDGITGKLFPPRDGVALAAALVDLIQDKPKLKTMGDSARKLAEERYDIQMVLERHMSIYKDLCKPSRF
ncbi:MAG: glycosyltransferase family 4 protein [Pseudomonadota bacterium]